MATGRPRKPTALKVVQGTARKDRINQKEPVVKKDLREPPDWLNARQLESWNYHMDNVPPGMLKTLDLNTLANFVVAEDCWRHAVEGIQREGMMMTSPNGLMMPSPYSTELKKYSMLMLRLASELGFTPSSRSKVSIADDVEIDDPWGKLANEA